MEVTLESLTPFHRKKVLERARIWRMEYRVQILKLMDEYTKKNHTMLKPKMPMGSILFDPSKWDACHWVWFTDCILLR